MKPSTLDTIFLPAPEPEFFLAAEQRARVPAGVDTKVLAQAMARVRPEFREHFLDELRRSFDESRRGGKVAHGPVTITVSDPRTAELLRQLFRPSRDPEQPRL